VAGAGFVEVDQSHVEHAAAITLDRDLPSLDVHLAVVLVPPGEDLVMATWDRGLHTAASSEESQLIPHARMTGRRRFNKANAGMPSCCLSAVVGVCPDGGYARIHAKGKPGAWRSATLEQRSQIWDSPRSPSTGSSPPHRSSA
jgi:hypothetical protein